MRCLAVAVSHGGVCTAYLGARHLHQRVVKAHDGTVRGSRGNDRQDVQLASLVGPVQGKPAGLRRVCGKHRMSQSFHGAKYLRPGCRARCQPAMQDARGPKRLAAHSSFAMTSPYARRHLLNSSCFTTLAPRLPVSYTRLHHAIGPRPSPHLPPGQGGCRLPRRYWTRHVNVKLAIYKDADQQPPISVSPTHPAPSAAQCCQDSRSVMSRPGQRSKPTRRHPYLAAAAPCPSSSV